MDPATYTTVVLKNRQSGMLVDHCASERIEAFSTDTDNANRHRQRQLLPL